MPFTACRNLLFLLVALLLMLCLFSVPVYGEEETENISLDEINGKDAFDFDERERAYQLSDELERFFRSLGLKTRLSELGITDKDFDTMAKRATAGGSVGHYVPLDAQRITDILKIAL